MKYIFLFFLISIYSLLLFYGCDSASDSVATTVTRPTLLEPVDNATGVSRYPVLKWSGEADKLEVSTSSNFSTVDYPANVTGTEHTVTTQLSASTTYFWHVGKTSGSTVNWSSEAFRFTTGN